MPTREYKIRVPQEIPEATSEAVAGWVEETLSQGGKLPPDPGGGPARLSLSLDSEKVVALANKKRERVNVVLRRVIAAHVKLEPAPLPKDEGRDKPAPDALLPDRVLPRKLAYEGEDFLDFVRGLDKGLAILYRRVYGLKELKPIETPAEDRKLADAAALFVNHRSPAWFVANADIFRLAASSFRWAMAQTEGLDAAVRESKVSREPQALPVMAVPVARPAAGERAAANPANTLTEEDQAHLMAPVAAEGDF